MSQFNYNSWPYKLRKEYATDSLLLYFNSMFKEAPIYFFIFFNIEDIADFIDILQII